MDVLKETTHFGRRSITVEGNPDLHKGDTYGGDTVKNRHTYRECSCCGDGKTKTLITFKK